MTKLIEKWFVRDTKDRDCYGKVAGIVGIICNLLLSAVKILIGLFFSVLSITADGLNNLSDATSSIVTLISFRLASMPADKEHPFGHRRLEYFSGVIVSFLILFLGIELGKESVNKIINPTEPDFSSLLLMCIVLFGSVLVKLWMFLFNRSFAKKIDSASLKATAQDCLNDVYTTSAVLLSLLISWKFDINLDGYMGLLVAVFILISGIKLVKETADPLLGTAADPELVQRIQEKLLSFDGILGVHDLMLHDYGPGQKFGSVHVEMDANNDVMYSHDITDQIERAFEEEGIHLVAHLDPVVCGDERIDAMRELTKNILKAIDPRLNLHDFRAVIGVFHCNLIFDIEAPFTVERSDQEIMDAVSAALHAENENYYAVMKVDRVIG